MNYLVTLRIEENKYSFHIFSNYIKARRYMNRFNFKQQNIMEVYNLDKKLKQIYSDYSDIPFTVYQDEDLFIYNNF